MKRSPIKAELPKDLMYYPRTYRHLTANNIQSILFLILLVLPALAAMLFLYDDLTRVMTSLAAAVLARAIPFSLISTMSREFIPGLGEVSLIKLPTYFPTQESVAISILIMILLLWFLASGRRLGKPVSIYLMIMIFFHMASSIYFFFASESFPYTATDYSELYVLQQVGIWFSMLVLAGLITGFLGSKGILKRIGTFAGVMAYSIVFGIVRYILFLYIIHEFSIAYMALLFFALGPFYDFMYLILIYGLYADSMIRLYDTDKGRGEWSWSLH